MTNAPRILETAHWRVEHTCPTSIKGWLVIALARHEEALHQLTEEEFATLARLLRLLSGAPADVLGSEKEYLMQFAEAPGHYHVHFHLVARSSDWPEDLKGSYVMKASGTTVENPLDSDEVTELAWTIREHMLEVADQI